MQSQVSRVLAEGSRRKLYLMGYVAAFEYQGTEVKLTKAGHWESLCPRDTSQDSHKWPTREQAKQAARAYQQANPTNTARLYTRPYYYETPNPKNAEGMPEKSAADGGLEYLS